MVDKGEERSYCFRMVLAIVKLDLWADSEYEFDDGEWWISGEVVDDKALRKLMEHWELLK